MKLLFHPKLHRNLFDALQASIAQVKSQKSAKKPAAPSVKPAPAAQKKAKAG